MIKPRTWTGMLAAFVLMSCGSGAESNTSESGDINQIQDASANTVTVIIEDDVVVDASGQANLVLENDSFDFGTIVEGTQIEHTFVFTNTGDQPLILNQVSASCGCTTPEYSKTPIAPGAEGHVKVLFDSNGQVGQQHKIINVANNGVQRVVLLHLRGEVTAK